MSNETGDRPLKESQRGQRRIRVIPTLLLDGRGRLVKTVKFGRRTYIGDPINAVKIFSTKEVDELILLDIDASREKRVPNYALIEDVVSEAFMPVAYGGGIRTLDHIAELYKCGIEKVVLSSCIAEGHELISKAAARFGTQAIVVCLQVKRGWLGGEIIRILSATRGLGGKPEEIARQVVAAGAGEVIVYAVDRDGTFEGFDINLLRRVSAAVDVPVVACGGARNVDDIRTAIVDGGCSAVAAGSMFVYQSRTRGVLISYPSQTELAEKVFSRI